MQYLSILNLVLSVNAYVVLSMPMSSGDKGRDLYLRESSSVRHRPAHRFHPEENLEATWADSATADAFGYSPYGEALVNAHPGYTFTPQSEEAATHGNEMEEAYPNWAHGMNKLLFETDQHGRPSHQADNHTIDEAPILRCAEALQVYEYPARSSKKKEARIKDVALTQEQIAANKKKMNERAARLKERMQIQNGDDYYTEEDFKEAERKSK